MKRLLVEVEIAEEPHLVHPVELLDRLKGLALDHGATVLQATVFDERDAQKPRGAS